jgi:hypothetical protein
MTIIRRANSFDELVTLRRAMDRLFDEDVFHLRAWRTVPLGTTGTADGTAGAGTAGGTAGTGTADGTAGAGTAGGTAGTGTSGTFGTTGTAG